MAPTVSPSTIPGFHPEHPAAQTRFLRWCAQHTDSDGKPYDPSVVLSSRAGSPACLVRYDRSDLQDGSFLTSWMTSSLHQSWMAKGWQVVDILDQD